jgi:hypothetical protein
MGNELDAYVYDYDTRGDDGCPLLVLTPADKSCHVFRRGRGGATPLRPPLPLGFRVGLGDNDNIDDNPTPSAGHTIHTQQSNRVKER